MENVNIVALVVALLGAGGIGAAIREVAQLIRLARRGVSMKEDKRQAQIVAQRDHYALRMQVAEDDRDKAEERADRERANRRKVEEALMALRLRAMADGIDPGEWPTIEG